MDEMRAPPAPLRGRYRLVLGLGAIAWAVGYWFAAQGLPTRTEFVVLGIGWMAIFVYVVVGATPTSYRLVAPRAMPENPEDDVLLVIEQRWDRDHRLRLTGPVYDGVGFVAPRRVRVWLAGVFTFTDWDRAVVCEHGSKITVVSPADPEAFIRTWERMTGQERW